MTPTPTPDSPGTGPVARTELLPCPHCGGKPGRHVDPMTRHSEKKIVRIFCSSCDWKHGYCLEPDAIEGWNRRAAATLPPATRPAVDETTDERTLNPWEFACQWYTEAAIERGIAWQKRQELRGPLSDVPADTSTPEFAKWLTHQYRLAMAKGIEIGERRATPVAPSAPAPDWAWTSESPGDRKRHWVYDGSQRAEAIAFPDGWWTPHLELNNVLAYWPIAIEPPDAPVEGGPKTP